MFQGGLPKVINNYSFISALLGWSKEWRVLTGSMEVEWRKWSLGLGLREPKPFRQGAPTGCSRMASQGDVFEGYWDTQRKAEDLSWFFIGQETHITEACMLPKIPRPTWLSVGGHSGSGNHPSQAHVCVATWVIKAELPICVWHQGWWPQASLCQRLCTSAFY